MPSAQPVPQRRTQRWRHRIALHTTQLSIYGYTLYSPIAQSSLTGWVGVVSGFLILSQFAILKCHFSFAANHLGIRGERAGPVSHQRKIGGEWQKPSRRSLGPCCLIEVFFFLPISPSSLSPPLPHSPPLSSLCCSNQISPLPSRTKSRSFLCRLSLSLSLSFVCRGSPLFCLPARLRPGSHERKINAT